MSQPITAASWIGNAAHETGMGTRGDGSAAYLEASPLTAGLSLVLGAEA